MTSREYELQLEGFNGPLDKLLELIEEKKFEITRLNLAEVTADFLQYVHNLEKINPRILSDFITIAARLILIKSLAILPKLELSEEEEGEIEDLENRLKLYREFRDTQRHIKHLWQENVAFPREYLSNFPEGFYFTTPIAVKELEKIIKRLYDEFSSFTPKTESVHVRIISLEEKIKELMDRVDKAMHTSFNEITDGYEQSEIIVLFLALLHLLKDSAIEVDQKNLFSDISIKRNKYIK